MESLGQYIISLCTAGILCALVQHIASKHEAHRKLISFLCGICMLITAIVPWFTFRFSDLGSFTGALQTQSEQAVTQGQQLAEKAMTDIIKSQSEAYILNKATSMGLTIHAEVHLQQTLPYAPDYVTLSGPAAPLAKNKLASYIQDTLGIPKEKQLWT